MSSKYCADGFIDDCNNFLSLFRKKGSLRFENFADVWQFMKFSYVFSGRKLLGEIVDFTEEALRITKNIWLQSGVLTDRICGFYLLVSLYFKQPLQGYVKIKITLDDWNELISFLEVIRSLQHFDAVFMLHKLLKDNAFHMCVSTTKRGLETVFTDQMYYDVNREQRDMGFSDNISLFTEFQSSVEAYLNAKSNCTKILPPSYSLPCHMSPTVANKLLENLERFNKTAEYNSDGVPVDNPVRSKLSEKCLKRCIPPYGTGVSHTRFSGGKKISEPVHVEENSTEDTIIVSESVKASSEDEQSIVFEYLDSHSDENLEMEASDKSCESYSSLPSLT